MCVCVSVLKLRVHLELHGLKIVATLITDQNIIVNTLNTLAAYLLCMLVQPFLVIHGVFFQNCSTLIALCSFNFGRHCKC